MKNMACHVQSSKCTHHPGVQAFFFLFFSCFHAFAVSGLIGYRSVAQHTWLKTGSHPLSQRCKVVVKSLSGSFRADLAAILSKRRTILSYAVRELLLIKRRFREGGSELVCTEQRRKCDNIRWLWYLRVALSLEHTPCTTYSCYFFRVFSCFLFML